MPPERRRHPSDSVITQETIDEFLEALWLMGERTKEKSFEKSVLCSLAVDEGHVEDCERAEVVFALMARDNYIAIDGENVSFSENGRALAKNLMAVQ